MKAVRAEVAAIDKLLPIFHLRSMQDAVDASTAQARLAARVVSCFAACALLLAMIGIYGVVAYAVRERQRELGIRIALGAQKWSGRGARRAGWHGARRRVGSRWALSRRRPSGRVLRELLYGIEPTDVMTYVATCLALAVIAVSAAWIPAQRAARVDPLIAMRPE